jgi:hypothetical protein
MPWGKLPHGILMYARYGVLLPLVLKDLASQAEIRLTRHSLCLYLQ